MALPPIEREDEAKRQIACKAGCSIREYADKFGKDTLISQARTMVHDRVLEEQREADEFEEQLGQA